MFLEGIVHGIGDGIVMVVNAQTPSARGNLSLGFANGFDTSWAAGLEKPVVGYPT